MERKNSNTHPSNRGGLLLRSETKSTATTSSDFVLQWGNRKRLRCMKVQVKDPSNGSENGQRTTARADRRIVRSDLNSITNSKERNPSLQKAAHGGYGHSNLRHPSASPSHRILRNSDSSIGMRGQTNEGGDRKGTTATATGGGGVNNNHHSSGGGSGGSGTLEGVHEGKKSGGSSSGGDAVAPSPAPMWLPKFVIALTNKEKEEDFMAIKGSKLPLRPKKRAKFIQRTLNAVSPGAWLCDLTLERYEVREKKVSKKRPRGLKAMGNADSDSE